MKHFKIQKAIIDAIAKNKPNEFCFSSNDTYIGVSYKGIAIYFIEKDAFMLDFSTPLLDRYNTYMGFIEGIINSMKECIRCCFTSDITIVDKMQCYKFTANEKIVKIDKRLFDFAGMNIRDYNYIVTQDYKGVFALDENGEPVALFMGVK